jgi:ADP-heptose:LPS heptosyltransferase
MRILFVTSTRVGDAIISTGLLEHAIRQYPGARVTVACGPAAAGLFDAVPNLDRVIVLDKMLFSFHWLRLWILTVGKFWDLVIDLRNAPVTYILFRKTRRGMPRVGSDERRVQRMARVLDLDEPPAPHLWISQRDLAIARELIPDGGPVLAVGPTANWRAKTWRAEHFAALIERLTGANGILPGARVAVFGRDDERPMALRLIDTIPPARRIDLVGKLDLLTASACLARCAFYVGNDSGLMHLAAASGVPTLGLFGPTQEALYAPWGEHTGVVRTQIPFAEIFPQDFDHRTSDSLMDSLTVEDAEKGARALWQRCTKEAA